MLEMPIRGRRTVDRRQNAEDAERERERESVGIEIGAAEGGSSPPL